MRVSITSTPALPRVMATYSFPPLGVMAMLFGPSVSGICFVTFKLTPCGRTSSDYYGLC